jgi:hypothetical protein
MDDGSTDIMAGIKTLRAKAEAQLTGNDYYMITRQLDALASSSALDPVARSLLTSIESRLNTGDTAASPAAQAPAAVSIQAPLEDIVVIAAPAAGSFFGGPQAVAGITAVEVGIEPETQTAKAEAASPALETPKGLRAAVDAVRVFIGSELSGNPYYAAANLLDQLLSFPPAPAGREDIAVPSSFEDALALLRHEIGWLSGFTQVEASRLINALARIVTPPAEPAPAETTPASAGIDLVDAPGPEPEAGPRVGFDDLADAAWQRVKAVAQADWETAPKLNGSAAPVSAMPKAEPAPAKPEPTPAKAETSVELMAQDMNEAHDDGGLERRSSEPCYAAEFELETRAAPYGGAEPAGEAAAGETTETAGEAAASTQTEILSEPAEPEPTDVAEAEPETLHLAEAEPKIVEAAAEAEPETPAAEIAAKAANEIAAGPQPEAKLAESVAEKQPETPPAVAETSAAASPLPEAASAEQPAAPAVQPQEPKREEPRRRAGRSLFGRLFGGRAAEHR